MPMGIRSLVDKIGEKREVLVTGLIVVSLFGLGLLMTLGKEETAPESAQNPVTMAVSAVSAQQRVPLEQGKAFSAEEQVRKTISEHERLIFMNPNSPTSADLYMAMGNLYRHRLNDYSSAINNYRQVITNFPESNHVAEAYLSIATCYERMADESGAITTYREMTENLPPDSEYHKFAQAKLESMGF